MFFAYGIVKAQPFELAWLNLGEDSAPLCLIVEGELAMLCAEMQEDSAGTRESMRNYTEVLCQIIKHTTIIPLRFGTMFDQEEQIKKILRHQAKDYFKLLTQLDNKIEVELKVWWKQESFREVMMKDKRLSRWKKTLESGVGQGYDVVEFGRAVQEVAGLQRKAVEKEFIALLSPLAVKWVVKEPVDEYQAFDGVFLVDRRKEEEFDAAVGILYDRNPHKYVFKYTGPWAPHHFVT